jgi:hypothetical protein
MGDKLQKLVAEIKKQAQFAQLGKPKAQGTPAGTAPAKDYGGAESIFGGTPAKPAGGTRPSGQKAAPNRNVINMQNAMQELARSVIRDSTSATMGLKPKDVVVEEATDPVKKSKKAFNDFVAEQYIGGLDANLKGVEWTPSQHMNTHSNKAKTQTDVYELDAVMNTLSRIGSEKSEFTADGNWGFRTDNALRNILGFAYALLQLEGDFGLSNNVYTTGNWDQFNKLLSGYKVEGEKVLLTPEQKSERAAKITDHLKSITKLYDQFRKQVTARPEFRPFIEGQKTFDKYPGAGEALSPEEVALAKSNKTQLNGISYVAPGVPKRKLDFIPLKALTSKDEYMKWMVDYAGLDEASAVKVFNSVIKPKIEAL